MRSPISLLLSIVFAIVIIWYFVFSKRHSDLPPDIAALEMAAADIPNTASCFSIGSVIVANGLTGDTGGVWTSRVEGEWMLRLADGNTWRAYNFVREDGLMVPFQYIVSDDLPDVATQDAIDALLRVAIEKRVPQVARCTNGGKGYIPPAA